MRKILLIISMQAAESKFLEKTPLVFLVFSLLLFAQATRAQQAWEIFSDELFIEQALIADSLYHNQNFKALDTALEELSKFQVVPQCEIHYHKAYSRFKAGDSIAAVPELVKAINNNYHYWYQGHENNWNLFTSLLDSTKHAKSFDRLSLNSKIYVHGEGVKSFPDYDSIFALDQEIRKSPNSKENGGIQQQRDSCNQKWLKSQIDKGINVFSTLEYDKKSVSLAYLIVSHSNDSILQKASIEDGKALVYNNTTYVNRYALLIDKYYVLTKGYQIFGTQIEYDDNKKVRPKKLLNKNYARIMRMLFDLPPLDQYLESFQSFSSR